MRRRTAAAAVAVAGALLVAPWHAGAATPCGADWPSFQHDVAHSGAGCSAIGLANVATLVPRWSLPTNGAVTAEPAVVGGTLYVGDSDGVFRAVDTADGAVRWQLDVTDAGVDTDRHAPSNGEITSSAAVADVPSYGSTVFFGGGGSVYAVDARSGTIRWRTDLDPADPTSREEVESSPVVWTRARGDSVVFVGDDTNEGGKTHSGLVALNAESGALLWRFDPQTGQTTGTLAADGHGNSCGDVWSSPALDPAAGLVFIATGNCDGPGFITAQSVIALDARDGTVAWVFTEPAANHGGDDDFGSSPVLTTVHGLPVVVEAGKSGWVYGLREGDGGLVFQVHAGQAGQTGDGLYGAIGGFIGAGATGPAAGHPAFFGNAAIPTPLAGSGVSPDGIAVDSTLVGDPTRLSSLHAVDLATGRLLWHATVQTPSYAPVTYTNGLLFAPATTGFALNVFDADNGVLLRSLPLAAAPSSGVVVSTDAVYFGAGTYVDTSARVPPQVSGIWSLGLPSPSS